MDPAPPSAGANPAASADAAPPESPAAGPALESADPGVPVEASSDEEALELEPLDGAEVLDSFAVVADASLDPAGTVAPAPVEDALEPGDAVVPPGLLEQPQSARPVARATLARPPTPNG
jgi:hypothetical protein